MADRSKSLQLRQIHGGQIVIEHVFRKGFDKHALRAKQAGAHGAAQA
jgi:hypothetical protein